MLVSGSFHHSWRLRFSFPSSMKSGPQHAMAIIEVDMVRKMTLTWSGKIALGPKTDQSQATATWYGNRRKTCKKQVPVKLMQCLVAKAPARAFAFCSLVVRKMITLAQANSLVKTQWPRGVQKPTDQGPACFAWSLIVFGRTRLPLVIFRR